MIELSNASEIIFGGKDVAKIEMYKPGTTEWSIVWEKVKPETKIKGLYVDLNSFKNYSPSTHQEIFQNAVIEIIDEIGQHHNTYASWESFYDLTNATLLKFHISNFGSGDLNMNYRNAGGGMPLDRVQFEESRSGDRTTIKFNLNYHPIGYDYIEIGKSSI